MPVAVFIVGWTKPPFAIIAIILMICGICCGIKSYKNDDIYRVKRVTAIIGIVIILVIAYYSGWGGSLHNLLIGRNTMQF